MSHNFDDMLADTSPFTPSGWENEIEEVRRVLREILHYDSCSVGSFYSLGPDVAKDYDQLILVSHLDSKVDYLESKEGYKICGEYEDATWQALRKNRVNLILTDDVKFFEGFRLAAEVCRALKLADKHQRIIVHKVVRDGLTSEEALQ